MGKIDIQGIIPRYYRPYDEVAIENEEDLVFLGKPLIREMILDGEILNKLVGKIRELRTQFGEPGTLDKKVKALRKLERRAKMKPAIPGYRPHGWFKKDGQVVCFIGRLSGKTVSDKFITGKISINTMRFISVELNHAITTNGLKGRERAHGLQRPELMNLWEFEYLIKHPKFAEKWLANAFYLGIISRSHAESFFSALTETRAQFRLLGGKREK